MSERIHFRGFWSGFFEKTNPTNVEFFLKLFANVYHCPIEIGDEESATILVENTQITDTIRNAKPWKHTYLFSGESYLRDDYANYTCVLYGSRNTGNIVNVPLYIPYLVSSFSEQILQSNSIPSVTKVPKKGALVMVSNGSGSVRNAFFERLEQTMDVTYAGHYKNNIGGPLPYTYNTPEFLEYVSNFQFIISMENSEQDTYITEKIIHGLLAGSIPVYWGSKRIHDYFSNDRILTVTHESSFDSVIETMNTMTDAEWLRRVNSAPCTANGSSYDLQAIASYIQNVIYPRTFPLIDQVYFICNEEYEPKRFHTLKRMCKDLELNDGNCTFLCPTYKHTITNEQYSHYVRTDLVTVLRPHIPMKRAEVSLFLNYKAVLEHVAMRFRKGRILIFESDVYAKPNWRDLNATMEKILHKSWDSIHIGGVLDTQAPSFCDCMTPYRLHPDRDTLLANTIEDLSLPTDAQRLFRKFHTRCTDSIVWTTRGCKRFLEHMNTDQNYGAPFDYYFINKLETDLSFKHYHSLVSFFDQASNNGLDPSTIQHDLV